MSRNKHSIEIKNYAVNLHNNGMPYYSISKTLNISRSLIRRWCNSQVRISENLHNKSYNKLWYLKNKEKKQKYFQKHKEQHRINSRKSKQKLKEKRWEEHKLRYKIDPEYKLIYLQRLYIKTILKENYTKKTYRTYQYLACSGKELKEHLERQFKPGMTWENHGQFGWHVDHILPLNTFDLTDPYQQRIAFNYNNLRPLWWYENLSRDKGPKPIKFIEKN